MKQFSYSVSGPLPLSGVFCVTRETVDQYGEKKYHSELNYIDNKWYEDAAAFSRYERFETLHDAARALYLKIDETEGSHISFGATIFVRKDEPQQT